MPPDANQMETTVFRLSKQVLVVAILTVNNAGDFSAVHAQLPKGNSAPELSKTGSASLQLTRLQALQMSTLELARVLLPNEPDGKFVSHELMDPVFPGGPLRGVQFFARPMPVGHDLCSREVTYASLATVVPLDKANRQQDIPVRFESASRKRQLAFAPQCRAEFGAFMAWVPESKVEGAQKALRRLLSLQNTIRKNAKSVEITCRTDTGQNICAAPFGKLLSDLPTDRIFSIESYSGGWRFSVMPNGPGPGLYWNVRLHEDRDKVELEWNIVPPF